LALQVLLSEDRPNAGNKNRGRSSWLNGCILNGITGYSNSNHLYLLLVAIVVVVVVVLVVVLFVVVLVVVGLSVLSNKRDHWWLGNYSHGPYKSEISIIPTGDPGMSASLSHDFG